MKVRQTYRGYIKNPPLVNWRKNCDAVSDCLPIPGEGHIEEGPAEAGDHPGRPGAVAPEELDEQDEGHCMMLRITRLCPG